MNLLSVAQTADSNCPVLFDADSVSIQDRHTQLLVGASPRRRDSPGLWVDCIVLKTGPVSEPVR
jgi:hypothetical protein